MLALDSSRPLPIAVMPRGTVIDMSNVDRAAAEGSIPPRRLSPACVRPATYRVRRRDGA